MLKLSKFRNNHHPSEARILGKITQRGFSVKESSMLRCSLIILALAGLLLAGCAGQGIPVTVTPLPPTEASSPTAVPPTETAPPAATATQAPPPQLPFEPATYRAESAGFEMEYPASWTPSGEMVLGERGSSVQFTELGEPRLDATILSWEPVNDLAAFIETRKQAWAASGSTILSTEDLTLAGGHKAATFVLQTPEGGQVFFLITPLGERYLQLSGSGDIDLLKAIARTLRVYAPEPEPGLTNALNCSVAVQGTGEWLACNTMDAIRSRNLYALHGYMADPFIIGDWGSEFRSASPEEVTADLLKDRLPADPAAPLTFTTVPGQFPPLAGQPPWTLLGPEVNVVSVIYSEGWGADGKGAALIFIAQDQAGKYYLPGMIYSSGHFDK